MGMLGATVEFCTNSPALPSRKKQLFSFCSFGSVASIKMEEAHMERFRDDLGLDRQGALVLALGWLAALWITLT
jgi:hypothetical protein